MSIAETKVGNFIIKTNASKSLAFHTKDKKLKKVFEAPDSLKKAKEWINSLYKSYRNSNTVSKVMQINFNTSFSSTFYEGVSNFKYEINEVDGKLILTIETEDLDNKPGNLVFDKYAMSNKEMDTTSMYSSMSLTKAEELNLPDNARYTVEEIERNKFCIIFDSVIMHKGDRVKLAKPGLSISKFKK